MQKTTLSTVKFNKLLENIHKLKVKKIKKETISYEDITAVYTPANSLFEIYMNNKPKVKGKNV